MFFQFLVEMFPGAVGIVGKGVILVGSLGWNSLLMLSRIGTLVSWKQGCSLHTPRL